MSYRLLPTERVAHRIDQAAFLRLLGEYLPPDSLLADAEDVRAYDGDALSAYQTLPWIVALPERVEQVQAVLQLCHQHGVPVVARGAGTGISGGALPADNGVLLCLAKLNRILSLDPVNRTVRVQPGVRNLAVSAAAKPYGLYYAPDPSSQVACSIGGNIAENSGGVHCLKYGLTVQNVLGVKLLLADGTLLALGSSDGALDAAGYDLLALVCGSEGLLGLVVEATLKLLPLPPSAKTLLAAFDCIETAAEAVAAIIAAGLVPAGLEMMDHLTINATEAFVHAGYPTDAAALVLCELDGMAEQVEADLTRARTLLVQAGATHIRQADSAAERKQLWAGRKAAFPAVGRISPDYYCMDGTIPRRRLAAVLRGIAELSVQYGIRVGNVFHAGDGNLHPLILYDANQPGQLDQAEALGGGILQLCIAAGGTITGEHGVGIEKINHMCLQFQPAALAQFRAIKVAFDARGLLNPGKAIPSLHRCAEFGAMHIHGGKLPFPELERF